MRPEIVVIFGPFRSSAAGIVETKGQAFVDQLVTHAAFEAFDIAFRHVRKLDKSKKLAF